MADNQTGRNHTKTGSEVIETRRYRVFQNLCECHEKKKKHNLGARQDMTSLRTWAVGYKMHTYRKSDVVIFALIQQIENSLLQLKNLLPLHIAHINR